MLTRFVSVQTLTVTAQPAPRAAESKAQRHQRMTRPCLILGLIPGPILSNV